MLGDFAIQPQWRDLLEDLGISPAEVLRRAGLPQDAFARRQRHVLDSAEYFRLWQALDNGGRTPATPPALKIGSAIPLETFEPALFGALCSSDLNAALTRMSRYGRLASTMRLVVKSDPATTTLTLDWSDENAVPPAALVASELVSFVQLARLATRSRIEPLKVAAPRRPRMQAAFADYFGTPISEASAPYLVFSASDAARPFLTSRHGMWSFFEPSLQPEPPTLDRQGAMSARVRNALMPLLPAGKPSMQAVAHALAISTRTMQRRLQDEGGRFQDILAALREALARHYLAKSNLSGAEIAFLLGFEDPNSFVRAFHGWTGTTPQRLRADAGTQLQQDH